MDFADTEEQRELRELARKILKECATPDRLREVEQGDVNFDRSLWAELARANLLGVAIAEEHGGMGFGFTELGVLIEECGRAVAPVPAVPTLVLGALPLARFGSDAQRARWLPGVAAGEAILTAGLVEPDGDDPAEPATRAVADADGWRITGSKDCVPFAGQASRVLVTAAANDGVGLFLLDPTAEGVALEAQESTAQEPQALVRLDGVRVATEDVLVAPGAGRNAAEWLLQHAQAAQAIAQVGVCDEALRMTAAYTATREQFGQKIATFQAVGQRAADAYIDVECLRLVARQAVWRLAEELPARDEVAIAKYWAGETGHRVSFAAQHLHGGIGVDVDYPLHRYCLWAKQLELTLGSSTHQIDRLGAWLARGLTQDVVLGAIS